MGKSLVGIFAIALLQIAFLAYTTVDGLRNAPINEVTTPAVADPGFAALDEIPEFDVRTETIEPKRVVTLARVRRSRAPHARRPYRSSFRSIGSIASTRVIRTGPGIPSGYSMVLVDYSPDVMVNGKPKEIRFR